MGYQGYSDPGEAGEKGVAATSGDAEPKKKE